MEYGIENLLKMNRHDVQKLWWNNTISFAMMTEYDRIQWEEHMLHFEEDQDKEPKTLFDKIGHIKKIVTNKVFNKTDNILNFTQEESNRQANNDFQTIIYTNMQEAVNASIYDALNNFADMNIDAMNTHMNFHDSMV